MGVVQLADLLSVPYLPLSAAMTTEKLYFGCRSRVIAARPTAEKLKPRAVDRGRVSGGERGAGWGRHDGIV